MNDEFEVKKGEGKPAAGISLLFSKKKNAKVAARFNIPIRPMNQYQECKSFHKKYIEEGFRI